MEHVDLIKWDQLKLHQRRRLFAYCKSRVLRAYIRLAIAHKQGKGVRLSADDVSHILRMDTAIGSAIETAFEEMQDADAESSNG